MSLYLLRCRFALWRKRHRGAGRLLACVWIVLAYSVMNGVVPSIFLARARATGDLWFYGLWVAALVSFATLGGLGCASVYRKEQQH